MLPRGDALEVVADGGELETVEVAVANGTRSERDASNQSLADDFAGLQPRLRPRPQRLPLPGLGWHWRVCR